jgi:acyl transferase domain-containing protein/acyl carrier protein
VAAAPLERLTRAAPAERLRLLGDWVLALTIDFLGFDADEELSPDEKFFDLGFDSLRAVDFKIRLEEELDRELSTTLLFECATPRTLAAYLDTCLDGAEATPTAVARAASEPLAIVGMACRFPGGANDLDLFWQLAESGRDAIEEVPVTRWDVERYYDEDPEAPGRMTTRWGGFLDDIDQFDAAFFGISPREARELDPAQRLLLELAWQALEHAALAPHELRGTATGVFIGTRGSDYFQGQTNWQPQDATRYFATGNAASTLAGRLSYQFGFTGPCFALDTACSSSLVALHQAALSLQRGECHTALVGAANVVLDPFGTIAISKAQMLAPDGRCKAFSAAADGYVRSEGAGILVLKRLADAQQGGDRILAVVRGSAVNQDGASAGLTVPSSAAQEAVIRSALGDAGLEPDAIDYIEAHGTGTSLGDPIEVAALDAVFATETRETPLALGTIKTQIGHTEPAAGLAGLIRVVLAMRHEKLTANLHFDEPNPHIRWDTTVVSVVGAERAWPRHPERPRRAGINSFGFSGTNAHVVIEEAPEPPPPTTPSLPVQLLPLSA